jgi:putative flippase GtrA
MLTYTIHLFTFQDSKTHSHSLFIVITAAASVVVNVVNVVNVVISPVIFVVLALIGYGCVACTTGVTKNGAEAGVRQGGVCRVGPTVA